MPICTWTFLLKIGATNHPGKGLDPPTQTGNAQMNCYIFMVVLPLPIQTYVFVKSLTVASSPTSTTLPTSLGKCFIKNCTPVVISFPPQAPAIQCLVQLAQCNCNRRTGRLHQILSPHCLCRLENCSRLSDKYIHQTSQQYETQQ